MGSFIQLDWFEQALCKQYDRDLFFSKGADTIKALSICARCPVREECLDWALSIEMKLPDIQRDVWGVYGGKTRKARLRLLRPLLGIQDKSSKDVSPS